MTPPERVFSASRTLEVWAMGQSVLPPSQQVQFQAMAAWADLDAAAPIQGRRLAVITIEMIFAPETGETLEVAS